MPGLRRERRQALGRIDRLLGAGRLLVGVDQVVQRAGMVGRARQHLRQLRDRLARAVVGLSLLRPPVPGRQHHQRLGVQHADVGILGILEGHPRHRLRVRKVGRVGIARHVGHADRAGRQRHLARLCCRLRHGQRWIDTDADRLRPDQRALALARARCQLQCALDVRTGAHQVIAFGPVDVGAHDVRQTPGADRAHRVQAQRFGERALRFAVVKRKGERQALVEEGARLRRLRGDGKVAAAHAFQSRRDGRTERCRRCRRRGSTLTAGEQRKRHGERGDDRCRA
jgi:hypothetical protein